MLALHLSLDILRSDFYLQPSCHTPRNQSFKPTNHRIYKWCNPDDLPIPPLHNACPSRNDKVNGAEENERPYCGESPYIARMVEVVGGGHANGQRPIQGGKFGSLVAQRGSAVDALDEACHCQRVGRGRLRRSERTSFGQHCRFHASLGVVERVEL